MTRLKMDPSGGTGTLTSSTTNTNSIIGNLNIGNVGGTLQAPGMTMMATSAAASTSASLQGTQLVGQIECYEDVFKEITKKLYGDEGGGGGGVTIADVLDSSIVSSMNAATQPIVYDAGDLFRQDVTSTVGNALSTNAGGLAIVAAAPGSNGLPTGTFLVHRRLQDDKGRIWTIEGMPQTGDQIAFTTVAADTLQTTQQQIQQVTTLQQTHVPQQQPQQVATSSGLGEETWFESDERLHWAPSKIACYNPAQKVFRCADCDFVGFLSRVAEHWLGNHADLRVFQCPRCPYTSAWARCVRMHLTRQHGETLADNSLWKENPVLEEVTKFLTTLKTKVEMKSEPVNTSGEKRYVCPSCTYQTDRRDLYNRHENIHRDEKPFQCYVCDKQFNRADHVKKHFVRMHREHNYDINKIKKASLVKQAGIQLFNGSKMSGKQQRPQVESQQQTQQQLQLEQMPQQNHQQQGQVLLQQSVVTQQQQQGQLDISQVHVKQEFVDQIAAAMSLGVTSTDGLPSLQMQSNISTSVGVTTPQIPHIAYFNPSSAPGQSGPLQGIPGVGGTKKEAKTKGHRKKKSSEKMYTCSYCAWQGVDNWCLKRHLNTHIKPFLCALCDYKAARSERLATHVLKVHNKRVCHKCSYLADDSESLSQHIQDSHQNPLVKTGFNCNLCQEYFELRADLEAHAILEHQKVIVQCDLCDFRTTDEVSMESHLREKHNLTPGMGAVAAAAAAAAAAAIGQPVNTQFIQSQSQPIISLTAEHAATTDQLLSQSSGVITTNPLAVVASTSGTSVANYSGSPSLQQHSVKVPGVAGGQVEAVAGAEASEPETLCEKCGIDFNDEQSRKLHERRHVLVNPAEDESVKAAKASTTKRFLRTYVCSTCSYTCATKKMMMQHQRAHTGFELVCQAEDCMFSTPFENTLKEHIQNDHGAEEHVRCPHCGMRIPSSIAFTTHWRLHHFTICSLCVNIYRIRYEVKENDIQEVICKLSTSPSSSFNLDPLNNNALMESSLTSADFPSIPLSDHRLVDDLTGLMMEQEGLDEPLLKRPKLDLPSDSCSIATLYKRESIKFLPHLVEMKVVPLPPKIKQKHSSRRRKRNGQNDLIGCDTSADTSFVTESAAANRKVSRMLKKLQKWENFKRNDICRVSQRRRYCQKGTFPWLYKNSREGFKCLSPLCGNKCSWRYPRKVGLVLHKLWYHRKPRFKCDICGLQFVHLYQAFLHKVKQHEHILQQQQQQNIMQQQQNQALVQVASTTTTQLHQQNQYQVRHFSQTHLATVVTEQNSMLS